MYSTNLNKQVKFIDMKIKVTWLLILIRILGQSLLCIKFMTSHEYILYNVKLYCILYTVNIFSLARARVCNLKEIYKERLFIVLLTVTALSSQNAKLKKIAKIFQLVN
jgi:hypothetical protein